MILQFKTESGRRFLNIDFDNKRFTSTEDPYKKNIEINDKAYYELMTECKLESFEDIDKENIENKKKGKMIT